MGRPLLIGTRNYTQIYCHDRPESLCNKYEIVQVVEDSGPLGAIEPEQFASIKFQEGSVKENGVNGCFNEDLIAIVIDRLQNFQRSEFACKENSDAIGNLELAMMHLRKRTQSRIDRGVEGTHQV